MSEMVRKGAAATSRAVAEQAVAAEQITKACAHLTRQIAVVSRAMGEQTAAVKELTAGFEGIRVAERIRRRVPRPSRPAP